MLIVRFVQHIRETEDIPWQILTAIVVLIPKDNSRDYQGIELLEMMWKLLARILDARLSNVKLHNVPGFRA